MNQPGKKKEYKYFKFNKAFNGLGDRLNQLVEAGWEVIHITDHNDLLVFILERCVVEESES